MSICLYTFEAFPLKQSENLATDFVCFSNSSRVEGWIQKELPLDILSFSTIRQKKILKILAWKYLTEYDVVVWCSSQADFKKALLLLEATVKNPDKDIWLLDSVVSIDPTNNLNLLSQFEKYSFQQSVSSFSYTDAIAYSVHSPDFKRFSISWISETLKESLYDEVSFSYLRPISKNLNFYEVQENLSDGFDCFFKIVVPSYNTGEKLRICLESILSQTFKSFKIVVVDDCSTDGSLEIAKQFVEANPGKVFLIESEKHSYSGHARNLGIQCDAFTSKYTWFVDGDDKLYNSSVLKLLYEKASLCDADLISFDCVYEKKGVSEIHKFCVPDFSDPKTALSQFGIAPWHRITKTEKLVPFFEDCVRRQDLATVFRQYAACSSFAHLDSICYHYYSPDYSNIPEPFWSLQKIWLEMKRQSNDESLPEKIRSTVDAYLKKYPKVFGQFEEKNPSEQIVVAMASYPLRKEGMLKTMASLLPQCDCFCLYLNEYEEVPKEIYEFPEEQIEKLTVKVNGKNLKDYGKFFWFGQFTGYYLTVDDDLSYSNDYCQTLVEAMKRKKNKAIVGMHGNDFTILEKSFVAAKTCHPFSGEEKIDVPIDCVGTGAAAFYPANMRKDFRDKLLEHYDLDEDLDMSASILAKSEKKLLFRVASKKGLVKPNGSNLVNPLANIHFAWEKRYVQYDLWMRKKSKNEECAICCSNSKEIDQIAIDLLRKMHSEYAARGIDFFFVPIEEKALQEKTNDSYFTKFEFVKKFLERYGTVSIVPLNEKEEEFKFEKEKAEEELEKIWKVKAKKLKRMNDKILKANLKRV